LGKEAQESATGHRLYLSSHASPPKKPEESNKAIDFHSHLKTIGQGDSKKAKSNQIKLHTTVCGAAAMFIVDNKKNGVKACNKIAMW